MLYENRLVRHLDVGILVCVFLMVSVGLVAIYSATYASEAQVGYLTLKKQGIWIALGLVLVAAVVVVPMRFFHKYAYSFYFLSLGLLVLVLFVGAGSGTRRWLPFGPFSIQPAEFAKVATILALAKYLSAERNLTRVRELVVPFLLVGLPTLLVVKQPDLGSALVFLAVLLPILHWAGLPHVTLFVLLAPAISLFSAFNYYSFFAAMILISLVLLLSRRGMRFFLTNFFLNVGVGALTPVVWGLLKEYQKKRILTFLGLESDPRGLGYQVLQSKVAIGSGGVFGKGFLHGTQTHLRFLPEQHTDFIFCVIGEEFGFLGVVLVLGLFLYFILKSLNVAVAVKSRFSSLVVFGAIMVFLFQVTVNIGMTVAILPVTGLPLPFLSYGGSSLVASLILVGLILNASRSRFEYI